MVENMDSLARFDSTQLVIVIVIIVQNIGIQLKVKSNNSGSFSIGSYTTIFRSGEFLLNSEARSSYSLNLDGSTCFLQSTLSNKNGEKQILCIDRQSPIFSLVAKNTF